MVTTAATATTTTTMATTTTTTKRDTDERTAIRVELDRAKFWLFVNNSFLFFLSMQIQEVEEET